MFISKMNFGMNGIDFSGSPAGILCQLVLCVDCGNEGHAGNVHQPELIRASPSGLLQFMDGTLVPFDFCPPD